MLEDEATPLIRQRPEEVREHRVGVEAWRLGGRGEGHQQHASPDGGDQAQRRSATTDTRRGVVDVADDRDGRGGLEQLEHQGPTAEQQHHDSDQHQATPPLSPSVGGSLLHAGEDLLDRHLRVTTIEALTMVAQ
jgi:hypothetical protein